MLCKIFILILSMLASQACTTVETEAAGEQSIQIRVWKNNTPSFVEQNTNGVSASGQLQLDVSSENVVDFDVKKVGDDVYVVYTTDIEAYTAIRPANGTWPTGTVPNELMVANVPLTAMVKFTRYRSAKIEMYIAYDANDKEIRRVNMTPLLPIPGVWIRLFKGVQEEPLQSGGIRWYPEIVANVKLDITHPVLLPLPGRESTLAVVSNKKQVMILNDHDNDGVADVINENVNLGNLIATEVNQLNTWHLDGYTYLSMIVNGNSIVTGAFTYANAWVLHPSYKQQNEITDFQVQTGREFPYAIWMNPVERRMNVAVYQTSVSMQSSWALIDRFDSVKSPRLSVSTFQSIGGEIIENTYIGTANEYRDFFQLFKTQRLDTQIYGPIISDWNEVYDIAGNDLGQVFFARADFDQQLIFAGLNTLQKWEQLQRTTPPPVLINPNSELDVLFVNDAHTATVFKTSNGSLYFLSGIR